MLTMVVSVPQTKAESAAGRPAPQPWCCMQRGRARRGMQRTRLVAARRTTPSWGAHAPFPPSPTCLSAVTLCSPLCGTGPLPGGPLQNPAEGRGVWEPSRSSLAFPSVSSPELAGSAQRGLGGDPGFSHVLSPCLRRRVHTGGQAVQLDSPWAKL